VRSAMQINRARHYSDVQSAVRVQYKQQRQFSNAGRIVRMQSCCNLAVNDWIMTVAKAQAVPGTRTHIASGSAWQRLPLPHRPALTSE
jgi:hypothetical protein